MFSEKASLIAESLFLVGEDTRAHWVKKGKYLLYVEDLYDEEDEDATIESKV